MCSFAKDGVDEGIGIRKVVEENVGAVRHQARAIEAACADCDREGADTATASDVVLGVSDDHEVGPSNSRPRCSFARSSAIGGS
jgi:hypothetical protein